MTTLGTSLHANQYLEAIFTLSNADPGLLRSVEAVVMEPFCFVFRSGIPHTRSNSDTNLGRSRGNHVRSQTRSMSFRRLRTFFWVDLKCPRLRPRRPLFTSHTISKQTRIIMTARGTREQPYNPDTDILVSIYAIGSSEGSAVQPQRRVLC